MKNLFDLELSLKPYLADPNNHGTTISRVLVSKDLLKSYQIKPSKNDRESAQVWCLSIGLVHAPKLHCYGRTLEDAFKVFEKAYKTASREERCYLGLKPSLSRPRTPKK